MYSCPQSSLVLKEESSEEWPSQVCALRWPVFALTASNPLGEEKTWAENQAANALLERDLQDLKGEDTCYWHSFGFGYETGSHWQEHGFVVSCERSKALALAEKYRQGAVYEFILTAGNPVGFRKTIPVLIADVEADVPVVPCRKPSLPTSEPDYSEKTASA